MPKKTTAARGRKTTAARTENGAVSDALVKKVLKARKNGDTWDEIMDSLGVKVGQITEIRARMRKLDPASVSNSGPSGGGSKKTSAKKTTAKKTVKKTAAAEKKTGRKKAGRKKARRVSASPRDEEA